MKICKVEDCINKIHAKGYCNKHYKQLWRYGRILKRTRYDPNEFIIEGNICRIKLYDHHGNENAEAIIDAEDYEKVKDRKWRFGDGYVMESKKSLRLARFIMNTKKGSEIDHKNGNKLDNTKKNLRFCIHSQNVYNQKKPINNTSGFKGVSWNKQKKKWHASIGINEKKIHLGYFTAVLTAARAYNEASIRYFGNFARLNEGV